MTMATGLSPGGAATVLFTRYRSFRDLSGVASELAWEELVAVLHAPVPYAGDAEHPGWSPVRLEPPLRKDAHVRAVAALVFDVDGRGSLEGAALVWGAYRGLVHTTRKHSPDVHRFRVVLALARHVTPAEHARLWAWGARRLASAGIEVDASTRNPSRFWYLPGTKPGGTFEVRELDGRAIDVDEVLAEEERALARRSTGPAPIPTASRTTGRPALEERIRRARSYLARMPAAVSGRGGHQATWEAALAVVRGFDLDGGTALRVLAEDYNPRCEPPWSRRELEHKVRSAERRGRVPFGYLLEDERRDWRPSAPSWSGLRDEWPHDADAYELAEREAIQREATEDDTQPGRDPAPRPSLFPKLSAAEVFAPQPPVPWLVEALDLCPGAPAMIAGYGFSKKTLAAQALALAVAAGRPVWGEFRCRRGRVLHLDYEQGKRLTCLRYQRLARGMGVEAAELEGKLEVSVMPPLYLDDETARAVLATELEGYDLVVVDSFRAAAPGAEENSSDVRRHLDLLTRAAEATGVTSVVIHHARKTSREQDGDARMILRGSSGIFDACSSVLVFSAKKGEPARVQHEKARTSGRLAEEFFLEVDDVEAAGDPRGGLRVRTRTVEQVHPPEKQGSRFEALKSSVLELVRREAGLTTRNAICVRLPGGKRQDKFEAIRELIEEGRLRQPGGEGAPFRAT